MNNKQSLISVSTLSYIWDSKQMDNIDLLIPFILNSINEMYDFTKHSNLDEKKIADNLKSKFSFDSMPIGVIRKVLERLCKKTDFIIRDHNEYYLIKDITKESEAFLIKQKDAEENISFVLAKFKEKLIFLNALKNDCTEIEVQDAIFTFLEINGYIIIKNINTIGKISVKNDKINLTICRIIIEEADNNTELFKKFLKLVEGYMLSNVIYLQIENNNSSSLKNLNVYLDSPLILEALGFKSEQANKMTEEMLELLTKQNAKVKCFNHNQKEVDGFLNNYKLSIKNKRRDNRGKTIELFDENNFTEDQVDNVIINLKELIKNRNIIVENTPCLDSTTHKENHNYVIDYVKFKEYIKTNYQYNNRISDIFIENDIDSINAISVIRKNTKFKNIDECKAIFVTKNYDLVNLTNCYLNYKPFEEIGLIISDTDLITLLWQKSYSQNKDLPRIKLLSNALAGYSPSAKMLNKINEIVSNMEKAGINDGSAVISNILASHTKKVDLMEITDGNPSKLTEEKLLKVINKEKDREVYKLGKEIENLKNEIDDYKKSEEEKEKEERINNRRIADSLSDVVIKLLKYFLKAILLIIFIVLTCCIVLDFIDEKKFGIVNIILLAFTVLGYIVSFASPFSYINKFLKKKKPSLENFIYTKYTKFKSKI